MNNQDPLWSYKIFIGKCLIGGFAIKLSVGEGQMPREATGHYVLQEPDAEEI